MGTAGSRNPPLTGAVRLRGKFGTGTALVRAAVKATLPPGLFLPPPVPPAPPAARPLGALPGMYLRPPNAANRRD